MYYYTIYNTDDFTLFLIVIVLMQININIILTIHYEKKLSNDNLKSFSNTIRHTFIDVITLLWVFNFSFSWE